MTDTAITVRNNEAVNAISTIMGAEVGSVFCSIEQDGSRENATKIYNAMNNPEFRVADFINKKIEVQDVLIEVREILNEDTGEIARVPRIVLIDTNGKGYQATSVGMHNAIRNAFLAFGPAPWNPALAFEIKQRSTKNGSMLTADVK